MNQSAEHVQEERDRTCKYKEISESVLAPKILGFASRTTRTVAQILLDSQCSDKGARGFGDPGVITAHRQAAVMWSS